MSGSDTIYAVGGQVLTITWYCEKSDGASPPLLVPDTALSDVQVGIRRRSDDYWYDWNDSTFKASAWTTRFQTLTEVDATNEPGDYEVDWTVPAGDDSYVLVGKQAGGTTAILLRQEVIVDAWPATATGVSAVETDTQDIQTRLPAALVSGRIDASAGAVAAGAITAAAIATDAIDADALAADALAEITAAVPTVAQVADGVWDEALADHVAAGSTGEALIAALYDGAIWIDVDGALTTSRKGIDGLQSTPVSTFAAAKALADAVGVRAYRVIGSGTLVLDNESHTDWVFDLAAGAAVSADKTAGISLDGSVFRGGFLTDGFDENDLLVLIERATVFSLRLPEYPTLRSCTLQNTISVPSTLCVAAMIDCFSDGATVDFSLSSGGQVSTVDFVRLGGDLTLTGMNAGDTAVVELAGGQLTLAASCTAGAVVVRGHGVLIDNSAGTAVTSTGLVSTAADIADAVWDEAIADHVGAGSTGDALNGATAAAVADAVWDEALADHVGAGSTGDALNGATAPTAAAVADAVWDEALADHVGAGSTGAKLDDIELTSISVIQGALIGATRGVVSDDTFYIKAGDLLPEISDTIKDGAVAKDLTGHTIQLRWKNIDTGTVETESATVVSATTGLVKYTWQSGDTATAGRYYIEWIATKDVTLEKTTYPATHYKNMVIGEILA